MKKFLSVFLALVMILAMSTAAFAAGSTTLRFADASQRVYKGYQLLELSVGLKTGEHHPASCDNVHHSDECYNYSYTVNEKYRGVLQAEVFAKGGNYLWPNGGQPASAAGITDTMILEYLGNQKGDNGSDYNTMRQVADRLYRAIQIANLDADVTLNGESTSLEKGYWMFADVTNMSNLEDANSLVMVDTKNEGNITVTPKVAIPSVEKKVKDIDDSEDSNISDNPWYDSADHHIGDTVPFKLTATLPDNAGAYGKYKIVLHDTLSSGLTFKPDSVKVYLYATKHKADADTDLYGDYLKDVTSSFTVTTTGLTDSCTFEVRCDNVLAIEGASSSCAFVVYYEATLNEYAVIGAAGNPNEVYLEFSNDPYGTSTGKTTKDKVTVFTYQLVINKTDSHGHKLAGAGFTLQKYVHDQGFVDVGTEQLGGGEGQNVFTWKGLDDGNYKLVETTVPEGYNGMAPIEFSVTAEHSEVSADPVLISLDGGQMGMGVLETGAMTKDIVNNTGTVLPQTGAKGTVMLIGISSMIVLMAAVFMITRKKMSVYED